MTSGSAAPTKETKIALSKVLRTYTAKEYTAKICTPIFDTRGRGLSIHFDTGGHSLMILTVSTSLFIVCSYATNTNISKGGQLSKCLVSFTEIAGQPQMKRVVRSAEICKYE